MALSRGLALALLVACSSSKRAPDDALTAPRGDAVVAVDPGDAAAPAADAAPVPAPTAPKPAPTTGDIQVRVEWRDVPAALRASPGRTPCATPRTPAVAPTTTWGIPDVFVIVERGSVVPAEARIVVADCTLTPRAVAARTLIVESGVERPVTVSLVKRGDLASIDKLEAGTAKPIQLPIAGHAVAIQLEAGTIYELRTDVAAPGKPESAWIIAAPAAVTEASGQVLLRDLAPGKHAVRAWLPPRAGAPARTATGTATVEAGDLADLTLPLAVP